MKISRNRLTRIIKEEISRSISEQTRVEDEEVPDMEEDDPIITKQKMLRGMKQLFTARFQMDIINSVISEWEKKYGAEAMKKVVDHIVKNEECAELWQNMLLMGLNEFNRDGYESGLAGGLEYNLDLTWTSPNPRGLAQPAKSSIEFNEDDRA